MEVFKAYRDHMDLQESRDCEEAAVLLVRWDLWVLAASQECEEPRVSLDQRVTEAAEDGRDQRGLEGLRAFLGWRAGLERRGSLGGQESRD